MAKFEVVQVVYLTVEADTAKDAIAATTRAFNAIGVGCFEYMDIGQGEMTPCAEVQPDGVPINRLNFGHID